MKGRYMELQATLIYEPIPKDEVFTPIRLAEKIVTHFQPSGVSLDPCCGDGVFWELLPSPKLWCEIKRGVDFFQFTEQVDWIISNPPYSGLLAWLRHSFTVAQNIVYLIPLHRVFSSYQFLADLGKWGGIKEILLLGTGTRWGFPFGHALAAVHFQRHYVGQMTWREMT